MQMSYKLDLLARNVITHAAALLGRGGHDQIVGVELDDEPRIAVLVSDSDRTPWRRLSRSPPIGDYAGLVRAAEALSAPWLSRLSENVIGNVAFALYRGGCVRLYIRPRSGEIDLALWFNGGLVNLARYTEHETRPMTDGRPRGVGLRDTAA
jgi:hypothetical protein